MKIRKKYFIISTVLILAVGTYFVMRKPQTVKPTTYTVTKSSLDLSYDLTASVESQKTIAVFSSNVAEVESVNYRINDSVNKGDVLLTLKSDRNLQSQIFNNEKLKLNISNLKKDYNSLLKLYQAGGASRHELDNAKLALDSAILDLKSAQSTTIPFEREIKSPISGVIIEANADVNYKIDPTRPLYKIADVENLIIKGEISNYKAKNIKEGQKVTVKSSSLEDNEVLTGKVKSVSKISVQSKTSNELVTNIRIELDSYSTLKPGDLVDINIVYNKIDNKIILPIQYIRFEMDKAFVFVLDKNKKVVKKEVKLGKNANNVQYEILQGISENDEVLDNSSYMYNEGDTVK